MKITDCGIPPNIIGRQSIQQDNMFPNRVRTGRKGKSVKSIERGLINLAGLVIFLGSLAFVGALLARWAI